MQSSPCGLHPCLACANSCCSAGGEKSPPGVGGQQAQGCQHLQRGCSTVERKASCSSSTRRVIFLQEGLCRWQVQSAVGVRVMWAPGPAPAWQPAWALPAKNAVPLLPAAPAGCWQQPWSGWRGCASAGAHRGEMFWDSEIGFRAFFLTVGTKLSADETGCEAMQRCRVPSWLCCGVSRWAR